MRFFWERRKVFSSAALENKKTQKRQNQRSIALAHQLRDDLGIDLEPVDHESWKTKTTKRGRREENGGR